MRILKNPVRSIAAAVLIIVLLFNEIPHMTFAEEGSSSYLDGWTVQAAWSDLSLVYQWDAEEEEIRQPKMVVTYRMQNAARTYPAGSLSFTIPGIGGANRNAIVKADQLAADASDSEWDYIWNQDQDSYIFTNRFEVQKGQSVSGGFELLWTLNSRDLEHGYSQKKTPMFEITDVGMIQMEPLIFSFLSERDRYRIELTRDKLYDEAYEAADRSYVWYEFTARFDKDWCSRGLYQSDFFVEVELEDDTGYQDILLLHRENPEELLQNEAGVWGFYPFRGKRGDLGSEGYSHKEPFTIGFRKDALIGKEVWVRGHLDRMYQDEELWVTEAGENEIVDAELRFTVEDYHFEYMGYIYTHEKSNAEYGSSNNPPSDYSDRMNAMNLYNGTIVSFSLYGKANRNYGTSFPKNRRMATASNLHPATASNLPPATASNLRYATDSDAVYDLEQEEDSGEIWLIPDVLFSGIGEDQEYSMVLGDDKLAVLLKDGSVRNLENHEYDMAYVTVEKDSYGYDYEIYGAASQDMPFEEYQKFGRGNTSEKNTFQLPDGIKAVFVRVNGIRGTYTCRAQVGVRLHLDWMEQQSLEPEQRPDHENHLANFSYLRALYTDEYGIEKNDCSASDENYSGIYGEELAALDEALYGEQLYRSYANVWLRSAVTNLDMKVELEPFQGSFRTGFTSAVRARGTISADNTGSLKRFSVYTAIPEGLYAELEENNIEITGTGVGGIGEEVHSLEAYASVSVRTWNEKQLLAIDFDCSDNPLEISHKTQIDVYIPVSLSYESYLKTGNKHTIRSYLMVHDDGLDRVSGDSVMMDEYDLDDDGYREEKLAYGVDSGRVDESAEEWREYASKRVRSFYSEEYTDDTAVRVFSEKDSQDEQEKSYYAYRLEFGLGSSHARNLVLFDRLEQGAAVRIPGENEDQEQKMESQWQGEFLSVDTEYAEKMGMIPTVYYSVNPNQEFDLSKEGWTTTVPLNISDVRSIAVFLDTSEMDSGMMEAGQNVYVTVHMRSPADPAFCDQKAVNQYTVQYDAYGLTNLYDQTYQLTSSETTVRLLDTMGKIVLQKTDGDHLLKTDADGNGHYAPLTGAGFQIYDSLGNALFDEVKTVNALGQITVKEVPYGTYYWEEIKAPSGYEKISGRHTFEIDGITEVLEIPNRRIPGTVILTKKDADSPESPGLENALFQLYRADGTLVFADSDYVYMENGETSVFATGDDGTLKIRNLPWGSYFFKEIQAPVGYEPDSEPISFSIGKSQVDPETGDVTAEVTVYNQQKSASIKLKKADETDGSPIRDAVFSFYQAQEGGDKQLYTGLRTNAAGEITVDHLKFGTYYFVETRNAGGYQMPDEEHMKTDPVILCADTVGETIEVIYGNVRKTGSVRMIKYDTRGILTGGAEYTLYHRETGESEYQVLGTYITESDRNHDAYGEIFVKDLPWGDYYFLETRAPKGYELSEEPVRFTIDRKSVQNTIELTAVNELKKGSVRLTKYDLEDPWTRLSGAVYELYRLDGTKCEAGIDFTLPEGVTQIETGEDGSVLLENLVQGAYYLREIQAPESYSISDEQIRFSITKENADTVQEVMAADEKGKAVITIFKEVNEVYDAFGNPTFLFRIRGDNGSIYTKSITLDRENLSGSVSVQVDQGAVYEIRELPAARYRIEAVHAGKNAEVSFEEGKAEINLMTETEGDVTFVNKMEQYEKFSHTSYAANLITPMVKLTSVSAEYHGPDPLRETDPGYDEYMEQYTILKSNLTVTAHYDDGTSYELPEDMYMLHPDLTDGSSESYTGTVYYEENGIEREASFSVQIDLPKPLPKYMISFDAMGGTLIPDGESSAQDWYSYWVKSGTQIVPPLSEPVKDGYYFDGWYEDKTLQNKAVFPVTADSNKAYYAKWGKTNVQVRYAVSIYGIQEDIDINGNLVGLTFGPATGDNYFSKGKGHTPAAPGQICMHDLEWSEIIEQSKTDPSVFQECLEEGCTHAVQLVLEGPLAEGGYSYPNMTGDGVGILRYSLTSDYLRWNWESSTYYASTSWNYTYGSSKGGWPDSAIRNTLNGTVTENMLEISNKGNGFEEKKLDETTALISGFPEELRNAIIEKRVLSDSISTSTSKNNVESYDKLWLFSNKELVKNTGSGTGTSDIRPNEGKRYSRQDIMGISTSDGTKNIAYAETGSPYVWWTRSLLCSYTISHNCHMVDYDGTISNQAIKMKYGISPGFCLPGPETENASQTE